MNFEKQFISKSVGILLQENLLQKDVDTLNRILQGKKAQYQEANSLLCSVLRAMVNPNAREEDEFVVTNTQNIEDNQSQELSQLRQQQSQSNSTLEQGNIHSQPENDTSAGVMTDGRESSSKGPNPNQKKQKEICRFYARGNCNRGGECRFEHPTICKKFRQFGTKSSDPKGCDGNCKTFHPNACRGSLFNRTCSFRDCRFFHLKGTQTITQDRNSTSNQNWRSSQHSSSNSDQNRTNSEPKNRNAGLNRTGKPKKREPQNQVNDTMQTQNAREERVTKKEIHQLGQTLEAIMTRLAAMEHRHMVYPPPVGLTHSQGHPQPSPSVPMPGTQTQMQWGSANPWPQTQF